MLLLKFALLQALDGWTTWWFLHAGVAEANPLIRSALERCAQPALALLGAKAIGLLPAWWAWRSGRHGLLRKINWLFAACVMWNLAALWMSGRLAP